VQHPDYTHHALPGVLSEIAWSRQLRAVAAGAMQRHASRAIQKSVGWLSLLRQPYFPHQLRKSWIGAHGIE